MTRYHAWNAAGRRITFESTSLEAAYRYACTVFGIEHFRRVMEID